MKKLKVTLMGWMAAIMLLVCACATPPEPYEYVPYNEIKPGPGLFTGEEGTLTIYRKAMSVEPEKDTGSEETQPLVLEQK
jgi:hypothetical protein